MIKGITDPKIWNDFARSCQPNTFLHSWEWGQVQKQTGEGIRYLGIYEEPGDSRSVVSSEGHAQAERARFDAQGVESEAEVKARELAGRATPGPKKILSERESLLGIALVVTVNARRGRHYLIPHGPLMQEGENYAEILREILTRLKEQAKEDRVIAVRVAPLLEASPASHELFSQLGFRPAPLHMHAELTWVLDIDKPADELLAGMRKTTRHAILKAQKSGVTTEIIIDPAEALERFWPLYEATRQRHGFVVWPKSMIKAQLDIFSAAGQIFSVVARYNNEDVAMAILPHFGDTVFYYHGASAKLPGAVPAAQLLQWAAIQEAKKRGAKKYNFWGIASEHEPHHPFAGITTFKKGFGGYAIDYLHAQDLPLSLGYWLLWAIDTFRKFRRGF